MKQSASSQIDQHNREIYLNRAAWNLKPTLRRSYREFYRSIKDELDNDIPGVIVEIGSGMGNIKEVIPHCITTDLFPNP